MIDSPPRKRVPLTIAAKMARMSNDIGLSTDEAAIMKDAAILLRQLHNACHKAGLTVEQLEGDAIGKLVEAASAVTGAVSGSSKHLPVVTWREDGSPKIDSHDHCVQFAKDWADLESALRQFQPTEAT